MMLRTKTCLARREKAAIKRENRKQVTAFPRNLLRLIISNNKSGLTSRLMSSRPRAKQKQVNEQYIYIDSCKTTNQWKTSQLTSSCPREKQKQGDNTS